VAVKVDLNLHRKPGLQLHVNQPKLPVHEVEINKQALPSGRLNKRAAFFKPEGKSPARFQYGKNADQSAFDSLVLGHFPRQIFLSSGNRQVLKRTVEFRGHRFRMLIDFVGMVDEKVLQTHEGYLILIQELGHGPAGLNR